MSRETRKARLKRGMAAILADRESLLKMLSPECQKAYRAGMQSLGDNPYPDGTVEHDLWEEGSDSAAREHVHKEMSQSEHLSIRDVFQDDVADMIANNIAP